MRIHFSSAHFLLLTSFWHFGVSGNKGSGNNVLPVHVYAGDDALVPCVVHLDGNNDSKDDEGDGGSVLWRRGTELLTAGIRRVSSDKRYGILHDAGGDVWVLVIRKATAEDAGLYICETNVEPVSRSFHKLSVLNRSSSSSSAPPATGAQTEPSVSQVVNHSDCCISGNVSSRCLPLCALSAKQLTVLPSDLPQRCAVHVPDIVRCVTDERSGAANGQQRKCCAQRVPIGCASWCAGRPPVGDSLKARLSCAAHAASALTCAADLLLETSAAASAPSRAEGRPRSVEVQVVSAHALNVSWQRDEALPVEGFVVTARLLAAFDDDVIFAANDTQQEGSRQGSTRAMAEGKEELHAETEGGNSTLSVAVPRTSTSVILRHLQSFSMYEIRVVSRSSTGDLSESSDAVRVLTLPPPTSNSQPSASGAVSTPPDATQCCSTAGLDDHACLKRMCSGANAVWVSAVDASACARWAPVALPCLLKTGGGINETACCQARGVPQSCLPACALHKPSTLPLDFVYDACAAHVTDVWACAVRKRRQLPSAPRRLRAPLLRPSFALLRWSAPVARRDTVLAYALRWRPLSALANSTETEKQDEGGERWTSAVAIHSRHDAVLDYRVERGAAGGGAGGWRVLERLEPGQRYEVFVQAVNAWGAGEASSRLIFATPSREWLEASVNATSGVSAGNAASSNASSSCCAAAGLPSACLPLCAFDVSLEEATALAVPCSSHLHTLLRCGANGREHGPCCRRRGVPEACLRACAGVLEGTPAAVADTCAHYIGDILQCFEEGAGLLPGPVEQLVADRVTDSSVLLRWRESSEGGSPPAAQFVVHYEKEDASASAASPLLTRLSKQVNVSRGSAEVRGLETAALYRFFVVAQNQHGSSLPSSILVLNVTHTEGLTASGGIAAVPSPPHSLAVAAHSATWLSVSWQPPLFSLPSQRLSYRLFHKAASAAAWAEARTGVTAHTLQKLAPNAQYIAYVVAEGGEGTSLPSETLVAWTDPAYPAFVEPPTVHPASLVTEGGSMTVLCIAMGAPTPTISLYVAGRLVRQEETRHMVTVVHNVTRDMETVACYADNGYGTPMQAARRVAISYPPHVTAPDVTWASRGESVALECRVWARPEPQMVFWRDAAGRVPVVQGGRFDISLLPDSEEEWAFSMRLTVRRVSDQDAGQYFCRADNALGDATKPIALKVRSQAVTSGSSNLTACCVERNVSVSCLDACSFTLDLSGAAARAECAVDLPALVRCAADGEDHRDCCALRGVPQLCSEWCAGRPLAGMERCAQMHATAMADCFSVGADRIPGPPRNVRVDVVDTQSARVRWDPPLKNAAAAAEMYRVFWREAGSSNPSASFKGDTGALSLRLTGLSAGVRYEAAVKAGNRWGSSPLSRAVRFTTSPSASGVTVGGEEQLQDVVSAAANSESASWRVGAAVAAAAVATLVAVAATAVWWAKRRRGQRAKSPGGGSGNNGGVSFENPSYLREMLGDRNQMSGLAEVSGASVTNDAPSLFPVTTEDPPPPATGWVTETLHFPTLSIIPSSHGAQPSPSDAEGQRNEQLSLSKNSVGFRFIK